MITYIIKIILCSALFLLTYFLFLEKEKLYRFNRFFLLFSILFSLIIPFLTIHLEKDAPLQTVNELVSSPVEMIPVPFSQQEILQNSRQKARLNTKDVLLFVYWLITAFLLLKFATNLIKMYSKIKGKKYISYKGSKLILTEENLTPHSFLNCMFLNKAAFEKRKYRRRNSLP